ncbi:4110_t:CDS:1, partial [Racocetra persica]
MDVSLICSKVKKTENKKHKNIHPILANKSDKQKLSEKRNENDKQNHQKRETKQQSKTTKKEKWAL